MRGKLRECIIRKKHGSDCLGERRSQPTIQFTFEHCFRDLCFIRKAHKLGEKVVKVVAPHLQGVEAVDSIDQAVRVTKDSFQEVKYLIC